MLTEKKKSMDKKNTKETQNGKQSEDKEALQALRKKLGGGCM